MRLLLAEDDQLMGGAMRTCLGRAGHATDWVRTGGHFDAALATHSYDCAILDLGLPDVNGEVLLRRVRARRVPLPVIVVTARGGVLDRIALLDEGADDYLVKPFDLNELTARIRSVMRRVSKDDGALNALSWGPLTLVPQQFRATWNDVDVTLTHREFGLLETLLRRRTQVLTRAQLEEALYGWGEEVDSNAIEVHVHFLRRKFCPGLIQTVRGIGYMLAPVPQDA